MNFFEAFKAASPALLLGLKTTVQIAVISIILAIIVGIISCLMSISKFKPFAWIAKFYLAHQRHTASGAGFFYILCVPAAYANVYSIVPRKFIHRVFNRIHG